MSSSSNNPRRNSDPLGLGDNSLPAQLSPISSDSGADDNFSNSYNLKERLEARMIAKATRESMTLERNRNDLQQMNHFEVSRELDSTYMAGYRQQGWGERGIPVREVDSGSFRVLNWYQGFPPPKQAYHGMPPPAYYDIRYEERRMDGNLWNSIGDGKNKDWKRKDDKSVGGRSYEDKRTEGERNAVDKGWTDDDVRRFRKDGSSKAANIGTDVDVKESVKDRSSKAAKTGTLPKKRKSKIELAAKFDRPLGLTRHDGAQDLFGEDARDLLPLARTTPPPSAHETSEALTLQLGDATQVCVFVTLSLS